MRLIPAIDLRGGHCVRLLKGDFGAETAYTVEPQTLLADYRRLGADWLHIVDLDGARAGDRANRELILSLAREPGIRLQVGGGLRDAAAVAEVLAGGVARAVIGSAAVTDEKQVLDWFDRYGAERIVLAFDVRADDHGAYLLATHGWREQSSVSLWDAIARYGKARLKHVLCTDVNRDGALSGPNLELYREALRRFPAIEWQASGGVRSARDLHALAELGIAAAISGRALLERRIDSAELRPFLPNA